MYDAPRFAPRNFSSQSRLYPVEVVINIDAWIKGSRPRRATFPGWKEGPSRTSAR